MLNKKVVLAILIAIIITIFLLFYLFVLKKDKNLIDQEWLENIPDKMVIENSILEVDLPAINDGMMMNEITIKLRNIKFISNNTEEIVGAGVGLRINYADCYIKYYFPREDKVYVYKDGILLGGYLIDSGTGSKIFSLLKKYVEDMQN